MENVQRYHIRQALPKDIVVLSRRDIIKHQTEIISKWKPRTDVWSLEHGRAVLSLAAALTGTYINRRFRASLKLQHYGQFPTALGLLATPAMTVYLLQTEFVVNKLLLYEASCPVCLESRSALVQNSAGLLLPLLGAPISNFSIAHNSGKFNVPYRFDYKGIFRVIWSAYQPLLPKLAMLFTFHALLAGFITHMQIKSFIYLEEVQHLLEQDRIKNKQINDAS